MAECILLKSGGGGTSSDECTATRADVLAGKYAVTADSGDEAATGAMPDRGAVSVSLPINGTYTIPEGYHDGNGKITQSIPVAYGTTINPQNYTQTWSVDKKYVLGDVIVNPVSLPANGIRYNLTLYGTTGTYQGDYISDHGEDIWLLHSNGTNNAACSMSGTTNANGHVWWIPGSNIARLTIGHDLVMSGYNYLWLSGNYNPGITTFQLYIRGRLYDEFTWSASRFWFDVRCLRIIPANSYIEINVHGNNGQWFDSLKLTNYG